MNKLRALPWWAWVLVSIAAVIVVVLLAPVFAVVCLVILVTAIVGITKGTPTWLRFRSRSAAIVVTVVAAVALVMTGSVASALSHSRDSETPAAFAATPSTAASPAVSARPTVTPTPTPSPTEVAVNVVGVVDGDTVDTSLGKIGLIGVDVPAAGTWGASQAAAELTSFVATGHVTVVSVPGRKDKDDAGRLLRYVRVNGQDAGAHLIATGWAVAKFDGRDGFGAHPLQSEYITADAAHEMPAEPAPAQPAPAQPAPAPAQPAPAPAQPDNDPRFGTCKEAIANGYGNYRQGVDPEYYWYKDADKDGIVCEH